MQQEARVLAQAKQRDLEQLKQLTHEQQALDARLHQARQDCESSGRKLSHLQQENCALQVRLDLHLCATCICVISVHL